MAHLKKTFIGLVPFKNQALFYSIRVKYSEYNSFRIVCSARSQLSVFRRSHLPNICITKYDPRSEGEQKSCQKGVDSTISLHSAEVVAKQFSWRGRGFGANHCQLFLFRYISQINVNGVFCSTLRRPLLQTASAKSLCISTRCVLSILSRGAAQHRGSICTSHPGLNPGSPEIFSQLPSLWTLEIKPIQC